MGGFWKTVRGSWLNSFLFGCLLLVIFSILFYLSNLDLKPDDKKSSATSVVVEDSDVELKKRMGASAVAFLSYDGWAKQYGLGSGSAKYDGDPDGDKLPNYLEYAHKTDPKKADTDGDTFSDQDEISHGYDPSFPGDRKMKVEVSIDKISVAAPAVWSKSEDEKSMLEELKSGVILFPKTTAPGQKGNMVISGHSSNYIWVKGDYNYIFKDLNNLENGDVINVKVIQNNGASIVYPYKVSSKIVTGPDDERIFAPTSAPSLTLSTCWPLGTAFRRLIVKADILK